MSKRIRAGLIGCGGISRQHIGALMQMDNAEIVAVCDIKPDRLAAAAAQTGAEPMEDWTKLVARDDIDIVHVLTPHYLHAPMAIAALKAGKHVLTEKPMASTIEDAEEMIRAADEAKGTLNVIFQNRYIPSTAALRRIIDSGEPGRLLCARASVCWHRTAPYYTESGWRGAWATEGGGCLINQSIHTLDLLSYLGGPIRRVRGHVSTDLLNGVIEVEDNCHTVFEYENGATGVIHATTNYGVDSPILLEMVFENGTYQLLADKLFKIEDGVPTLLARGDDAKELGVKSYWGAGHILEITRLYDCLQKGEKFEIDGRSAFPALCLVKTIYESSAKNDWVALKKV